MMVYNGVDKQGVEVQIDGRDFLLEEGIWYIRNIGPWEIADIEDERVQYVMHQIEKELYFLDVPNIRYKHATW